MRGCVRARVCACEGVCVRGSVRARVCACEGVCVRVCVCVRARVRERNDLEFMMIKYYKPSFNVQKKTCSFKSVLKPKYIIIIFLFLFQNSLI